RSVPMRSRKTGRRIARAIKSMDYRLWEAQAALGLKGQGNPAEIAAALPRVFGLEIQLHPPDLRHRDADNLVKAAQDLVCRWLGVNDARVGWLFVGKGAPKRPDGVVQITLLQLLGADGAPRDAEVLA
ncbi:MAG: hypothetical protein U0821_18730, partial [Chloroflexota bacterium]